MGKVSFGSKADLYLISGVMVKRREVSAVGVVAKCGDSSRVNLQRASVGGGYFVLDVGVRHRVQEGFPSKGCTSTRYVKGWVSSQRTACAVSEM